MMSNEPPRPYYIPKPPPQQPPKRAVVVPVAEWTVARVLFWRKDAKKK